MSLSLRGYQAGYVKPLVEANLTIEAGVYALYGNSGIGKTTFLKTLAGFIAPLQCREATYTGKRGCEVLLSTLTRDRPTALAQQETVLVPSLTLRQNVNMVRKAPEGLINRMCAQFGLKDVLDKYPSEVSVGQAHRAYVLRAIASDKPVLLLDEPLAALDEYSSNDVLDSLNKWASKYRKIVIIASHKHIPGQHFTIGEDNELLYAPV